MATEAVGPSGPIILAHPGELDTSRLAALERRVASIEEALALQPGQPDECRAHTCTYFTFYLANGPATLVHEGYHSAEKQCVYWQSKAQEHLDGHPPVFDTQECARCQTLERI